ncbi:SpoIIE family protein phosphatase [candidate division KSB1 bacterium]|nr:SpoIIE family protein phosphatase [candidate division KSB1 bacterium]
MSKEQLYIRSEMDVLQARKISLSVASKIGFTDIECAEIEIIISELGTNIIKHANSRGMIILDYPADAPVRFLEITARDFGNGATGMNGKVRHNTNNYFEDGYSTSATLGIGLPGVRRLADEFDFRSNEVNGVDVVVKKINKKNNYKKFSCSAFTCPKFGEKYSGDNFYLKHLNNGLFFCVIDSLGHGYNAYKSTQIALNIIQNNYQNSLSSIIEKCHENLRHERGAAIALGRIDLSRKVITYLAVGNIVTWIYSGETSKQLMYFNGTVGVIFKNIHESEYPVENGSCLVVCSDGISSKFDINPELQRKSAQEIAHYIFKNFTKSHDDATVLAIK